MLLGRLSYRGRPPSEMSRSIQRWTFAAIVFIITWLAVRSPWSDSKNRGVVAPHKNASVQTSRLSVVAVCDIGILLGIERAIALEDIAEVILSCGEEELSAFKSFWTSMAATFGRPIRIVEASSQYSSEFSLLLAASDAVHANVLILDSDSELNTHSRAWIDEALHSNTPFSPPIGPCGFDVLSTGQAHPANLNNGTHGVNFLRPPFIIDHQILITAINGLATGVTPWAAFGKRLGTISTGYGGIQTSLPLKSHQSCPHNFSTLDNSAFLGPAERISFMLWLTDVSHLVDFQDTFCRMASRGNVEAIIRSSDVNQGSSENWIAARNCYIRYKSLPSLSNTLMTDFEDTLLKGPNPDVLIYLRDEHFALDHLSVLANTTLIPLERQDLPHAEWLANLDMEEWKSWNSMQLELAVITNTRPRSLARLLSSLNSALYFGHSGVHLTINMEQTADAETRRIAQHFQWSHGSFSVRHRVVLGGLIPAIVESWYPTTNHSFGLILEDDIEVSPLYFAWIKMNVLRYRYGKPTRRNPYLYGISLYHPKNVELRPEGRRPWSAQELFRNANLPFPYTPYLAATPCSWGAVYFPEHWREFHDYLIKRMSESFTALDTIIVPNVRSNFWKKSWKRFFIEFSWLRGYVMLYPNYDNFLAFSTNHVEVGSHVSDVSAKARKKALFAVPLMSLQDSMGSFLQLPSGQLPDLDNLPVVDLHGHLSTIATLQEQGEKKRRGLCENERTFNSYDASELLC